MKSSEILREAAAGVEAWRGGLFSATRYYLVDDGRRVEAHIRNAMPEVGLDGCYRFAPLNLPAAHRATILCLAAAIAESEGD